MEQSKRQKQLFIGHDMSQDVPQQFLCPISQRIMIDPVLNKEGISFQRAQLAKWIQKHHNDPFTRQTLKIQDLKPNRALRDTIQSYLKNIPKLKRQKLQLTQMKNLIAAAKIRQAQIQKNGYRTPMSIQEQQKKNTLVQQLQARNEYLLRMIHQQKMIRQSINKQIDYLKEINQLKQEKVRASKGQFEQLRKQFKKFKQNMIEKQQNDKNKINKRIFNDQQDIQDFQYNFNPKKVRIIQKSVNKIHKSKQIINQKQQIRIQKVKPSYRQKQPIKKDKKQVNINKKTKQLVDKLIGQGKTKKCIKLSFKKLQQQHLIYLIRQKLNLSIITKIDLSKNYFGDQGVQQLSRNIFINLKQLNLSRNKITRQGLKLLCNQFSQTYLPQLEDLDISCNKIGSGQKLNKQKQSQSQQQQQKLNDQQDFNIDNEQKQEEYSQISKSQEQNESEDQKQNQQINSQIQQSQLPTLAYFKKLKILSLSYNNLSDFNVGQLFKTLNNQNELQQSQQSIQSFQNLEVLYLHNNNIISKGIKSLLKANLKSLIKLSLSKNKINQQGIKYLINNQDDDQSQSLFKLKQLYMYQNNIKLQSLRLLKKNKKRFKNLKIINIDPMGISSKKLQQQFKKSGAFPKLYKITVSKKKK